MSLKTKKAAAVTRDLEVGPLLRRSAEVVDVLEEVAAAGHDELVAAFLRVAAGVKFYRQVDGSRDVNLVLKSLSDFTY